MAGDFAGGGTAHTIADDEGAGDGIGGAGVFISGADAAGVGEHGVNDSVGWHSLGSNFSYLILSGVFEVYVKRGPGSARRYTAGCGIQRLR